MTTMKAGVQASSAPPALEMRGVNKWFGTNHANKDITFAVEKGSIHGLVGENGAGKSTIMSIVYGYYQADGGQILVDGREMDIRTPSDAIDAGIGMVHQHFMLVDPFTVLENVILGVEGGATLRGGVTRARGELERLQREYELEVDPDAVVGDLAVGLQQRVEILKALYRGAETLILDEPTGVLTPQEADHLFRILRALKEQGKTIIIITHKLREIMDLTDRVTVMRRGEVVGTLNTADTSKEELAELMVGRKVLLQVDKGPANPGASVLEVSDLHVPGAHGGEAVKGVSFHVRAGEIVGIAGVAGNGQSELMEALAGMRKPTAGRIMVKGQEVASNPDLFSAKGMRRLGVAHVPEDRHREGLVKSFEACESAILGYHDDPAYNIGPILSRGRVLAATERYMKDFDVRPPAPTLKSANFSGGNQQKIVLAREMERNPDLLLVGQPTRGVDIGAIEFIHRRLIEMRDAGKAVLLVSVELDEVMSLADRILVVFDGRIVGEISPQDATERRLGLMMAGIKEAA